MYMTAASVKTTNDICDIVVQIKATLYHCKMILYHSAVSSVSATIILIIILF